MDTVYHQFERELNGKRLLENYRLVRAWHEYEL